MTHVEHLTDGRVASAAYPARGPSGRVAVLSAIAGLALQGASGYLFVAATGPSAQMSPDPVALLGGGASGASLLQWASVVDLFGYLLVAPLVMYLHHRFRDNPRMVLYTAAGFAYILVGALGAVIFLAAGPMFLRDYVSAGGTQQTAITTTFTALYQIVVKGLWQTLESIAGGVWLLGSGINLYRARHRALSIAPFAFGGLFLVLAAIHLLGW